MKPLFTGFWILSSSALAWGQGQESRDKSEPWSQEGFSLPAPGTIDFESVSLRIDLLYARGYDSIARFDLDFAHQGNPATATLEGTDYDLTAPAIEARIDVEWLEISLRYARGSGSGDGRAAIHDGFLTIPGTLDYDFAWNAFSVFAERELASFRGTDFRIGVAGGIGLLYLRETWDEIRITPDDTAFSAATIPGSHDDDRWIAAVALEIRGKVKLGTGWFLSGDARGEWHVGNGIALVGGIGIGLEF